MIYTSNSIRNADFYECLSNPYENNCENVLKCIYIHIKSTIINLKLSVRQKLYVNETAEIIFPLMIIAKLFDYYHHCNICLDESSLGLKFCHILGCKIWINKSDFVKLQCVREYFIFKNIDVASYGNIFLALLGHNLRTPWKQAWSLPWIPPLGWISFACVPCTCA